MAKQNVSIDEKRQAVLNYRKMMDNVEAYEQARDNVPKNYAPSRFDTLKTFLEQRYMVPEYQRDYAWRPEDQTAYYLGSVERSMLMGRPIHSLGDVIVHREVKRDADGNRVITLYLVDGQQRVTTQILVLIVLRDILQSTYFESEQRKASKQDIHPKVTLLQGMFKKPMRYESGEEKEEYALLSRTRPLFNNFIIDLYENVGATFNLNNFIQKYKECPDTNVQNAIENIRFIHDYFHSTFRGRTEAEKRMMIDYYACYIDAMLNSVVQGVVELTNADNAKETYYTKNMTGMRMSDVEGFRFMIIANNTPESERVYYGEKWNKWVDKYKEYGRSKSAGEAMGLLTLVRSNLKAKYTEFAPRHSGANESVLYDTVKDTVIYGSESLNIKPNEVILAHEFDKMDKYFDMIKDIENPTFSDAYRQSYTYLRLASPSPKWLSALLVAFDLFGKDAYKIIDKYIKEIEKAVMFMITGKDSTNMSLIDDILDTLICGIYRKNMEKPFTSPYAFVEAFEMMVREEVFVQKDGTPVNEANFKAAWEMTCSKKSVKVGVSLSYEYVTNPTAFYKNFKHKELSQIEFLPLLEKSGVNLEYGSFANMHNARWSGMIANAATLKRNKTMSSAKVLQIARTQDVIHAEVKPFAPSCTHLWNKTIGSVIGKKNATYTITNMQAYSNAMRKAITANLGFNF